MKAPLSIAGYMVAYMVTMIVAIGIARLVIQ